MSGWRAAIGDHRNRRRAAYLGLGVITAWVGLDFVLPHLVTTTQTSTGRWQTPLPVVVLGLIAGSTYGLLAAGLVLVYRSSRIINFAHGEVGAFAASFFGLEVVRWHLPYWVALVPALCLAAAVGAVLELAVIRRLVHAALVMSVIATLAAGQFLGLLALVVNSRANASTLFPQPAGLPSFEFGKLLITPAYTGMLILTPLAVLVVGGFLKRTRYGRSIRASAANPDAARLAGIPVARMSSVTWALAGGLAALAAILSQATTGFSSGGDSFGPQLLLIALTGAVLGRMRSLPGAVLGGLAVGVTQQLLLWNSPDSGLVELVLFGGILLALLVQRSPIGRGEDKGAWSIAQPARPLPAQVRAMPSVRLLQIAPWLLLFVVLAVLPLVVSNATSIRLSITFAFIIVALSVGVVTGLGGQLSLGQFAVAAVGAVVSYEVSRRSGNFFASFACAGAGGAVISVILGLPAIRARGLLLTVTTLAFAFVMPDYLLDRSWLLDDGRDPGRPILFGHAFVSGHSYYYVGLVTVGVSVLFARNVRRGGIGRRLIAVRDNEEVARSFGLGVVSTKAMGYALAGFLAGLGGAMYGHALAQLSIDAFPAASSIDAVKIAVIGGVGALSGPFFGAALVQGVNYVTLGNLGLALVALTQLLVILTLPAGFVQLANSLRDWLIAGLARRAGVDLHDAKATERDAGDWPASTAKTGPGFVRPERRNAADHPVLDVAELDKSFEGIHAVRGLSLTVQSGETVGLIGPNGAGKTTTFELIAGFVRADHGTVRYRGTDVTRTSPQSRARMGMIRSFQDAALFPTLTATDCVALALERRSPTSVPASLLGSTRADRRKLDRATQILEWMGLERFRSSPIQELSTGTRRLVELACLVALEPDLLLLDEPSSGVAQHETKELGELLVRLRSELALSMIVIEHDIPLVMALSDRIVCMADGEVIAAGTPGEVQADPRVVAAYLGGSMLRSTDAPH